MRPEKHFPNTFATTAHSFIVFFIMKDNVKNFVSLKLPLLCHAGISAGLRVCASEHHGLRSHPSGALLSQHENPIHCLSPPG